MEEKITEIMKKYNVVLGYLFGSYAKGAVGPMSDIDVAVFLLFDLSEEEQKEKIREIKNDIQKEFQIDYVDVINLRKNENIVLGHRIVFEGKPLVVKDEKLKLAMESKYLHQYEDTRYFRSVQFKILKNHYLR